MAPLDLERTRAQIAYNMLWGVPMVWQKGTVDIPADNDDYPWSDPIVASQHSFEYIDVKPLIKALALRNFNKPSNNVYLVRRAVYDNLVKALENGSLSQTHPLVINGHPGIGKSFFLLFLLMHRLQNCQPTAFQYHLTHYFLFDEKGGTALDASDIRLERCWALTDSNDEVKAPSGRFKSYAERNILASSPKARWTNWLTQGEGSYTLMELPTMEEIVAIMHLRKALPSAVIRLVRTWGPCLRVVGQLSARPGDAALFSTKAKASAMALCASPAVLVPRDPDVLTSIGSTLLFVRPRRLDAAEPTSEPTPDATLFVPTRFLSDILHDACASASNLEALKLFSYLSRHSLRRSPAGWDHEQSVHNRMTIGGTVLTIFRNNVEQEIPLTSSTDLLPGTLAGIKGVSTTDSFYWLPAAISLPGIDSVLGDGKGNFYAVQTTIRTDHSSPATGLEMLWKRVNSDVQKNCNWHVVLVADDRDTADSLLATYSHLLQDFTLGGSQGVTVWGCVLSR
ncbi:hypothetical protein EXIGLDRAFT_829274 [Exidia glandulosa HHB12029]|uniref:Uncharacterized protein n=1 Tax=Exidia glandulosa HHB12029 TaxID=1314781 RepID=A0A165PMC9_EXIGL|nr:hypothetical protein EXIGLDRAFT_829274 [Exidia glandulosa HHB12029]